MQLHAISLIFCILFFTAGYATEIDCDKNLPPKVKEALFKALNKKCPQDYKEIGEKNYDCGLARRASRGRPTERSGPDAHTFFDGQSIFDFNWEKSLTDAVNDAYTKNTMATILFSSPGNKIGCYIRLSTSNSTGAHTLNLSCNYKFGYLLS